MQAENPVLLDGQPGYAYDSTGGILKIGDGTTAWNDLPGVIGSNSVRYYTETNPLLNTSPSVGPMYTFSWNIPVTTSGVTHRPIVQVYDAASTDEELVLTDVMINSDYDVTIKITVEATSISAGSYRAIVIG